MKTTLDQKSIESFIESLWKISLALVFYTLLVILWGAWVRISHSGDGCGDTWPLCQGQLIPDSQLKKTWVEYSHRFTSGLYGLLVLALFFWIKKQTFHSLFQIKRWSFWVLIFMITEALLGAKLVIFKLVNLNDSLWRVIVMSLHQLNSFLLVGFTVRLLCAALEYKWFPELSVLSANKKPERMQKNKYLLMILVLAMTGAWAALSTTLFPSVSLLEGFIKDFAMDSHSILKIRITHPILAVSFGIYMIYYFVNKYSDWKESVGASEGHIKYQNLDAIIGKLAKAMAFSVALAVLVGIITLLSLSPTSLKLIHLTLAHILWILGVFYYHFSSLKKRLNIE